MDCSGQPVFARKAGSRILRNMNNKSTITDRSSDIQVSGCQQNKRWPFFLNYALAIACMIFQGVGLKDLNWAIV